jgi:hypothetical protein
MVERKRIHIVNRQAEAFDVNKVIKAGALKNEADYERAMIADRKLRLMAREDAKYKAIRSSLRRIIAAYEKKHWKDEKAITKEKVRESDLAELSAERERQFLLKRKELIRERLKKYNMTQQQLGEVLDHPGKSYVSELINGISPFSNKDLSIISRLLKIDMNHLVSTFIPLNDCRRIITVIKKQNNPKLKIEAKDLVLS